MSTSGWQRLPFDTAIAGNFHVSRSHRERLFKRNAHFCSLDMYKNYYSLLLTKPKKD